MMCPYRSFLSRKDDPVPFGLETPLLLAYKLLLLRSKRRSGPVWVGNLSLKADLFGKGRVEKTIPSRLGWKPAKRLSVRINLSPSKRRSRPVWVGNRLIRNLCVGRDTVETTIPSRLGWKRLSLNKAAL